MGGIAEKIARHASIPALLLNEAGPSLVRSGRDTQRPLRVLVPLDGSRQAEAALLPAIALLRALATLVPAELYLMQVVKLPAPEDERRHRAALNAEMQARAQHEASAYLAALADRLRAEERQTPARLPSQALAPLPVTVTWSVAFAADVAELLVMTAAHEGEAGDTRSPGDGALIALTALGRGGVAPWVLGHVAERVLHAEDISVLLVHQPYRAAGGSQAEGSE